jgi:hypothetical protein
MVQNGRKTLVVMFLLILLWPVASRAQDPGSAAGAQTGPRSEGPMIIQRIESGFVIAPDFKVTEFDDKTSMLAGFYGGWLEDKTFFVGGGGYWLTNGSHDQGLAYGGLVLGWSVHGDRKVGFGAKSLIGGGVATLASQVTTFVPGPRPEPRIRPLPPTVPVTTTILFDQGFFIFEPEANVFANLSKHFRLTGGIGYRVIGEAYGYGYGYDTGDRIGGITGSVALQIGP